MDCTRKVNEDFDKAITNAYLGEERKRLIDWKGWDKLKETMQPALKAMEAAGGALSESKHSEVGDNVSDVEEYSTPGGVISGRQARFQGGTGENDQSDD